MSGAPEVTFSLPPALAEHARAWLDAGGGQAAPPRDASTVMLLREGEDGGGLEVFVLRRAATMSFAASAYVFPGGGVDGRDAAADLPWAGPSPAQWAGRLAAPTQEQARELVVAAARELFEECGVLLAGPDERSVVCDLTAPEWDAARAALVAKEISFAQFLIERGLVLRSDLLRALDHWITPEFEPRRFDTRFFVAVLPAGQVPDDDCTEADHVRWVRAADLLAERRAGAATLLPPTELCLQRLAGEQPFGEGDRPWDGRASSLLDVLDDGRPLPVVLPRAVDTPDGVRVVRQWASVEPPARKAGGTP